jgi:Uma2 family endonuclease
MEAIRILPHYTYDDYVQWQGKWELIDGIPFAMSPSPKPKHQRIATAISAELHFALKKCKHCHVYDPLDYKISEETILQPDVLVVCGPIEEAFLDRAPELIVEVLSPATASKDKLYKLNVYQDQRVPYYFVVDVDKETVQVLQLLDGKYEFVVANGRSFEFTFSFAGDCQATIDFNEIWS